MIVFYLLRWAIQLAALRTDALHVDFIVRLSVRIAAKLALIVCFPFFLYVRSSICVFGPQNFPRAVHDSFWFFAFVVNFFYQPFFATINTKLIDRDLYDLHSPPIVNKRKGKIAY